MFTTQIYYLKCMQVYDVDILFKTNDIVSYRTTCIVYHIFLSLTGA